MEFRLFLLQAVNATNAAADPQQSIYFGVAALLGAVFLALSFTPQSSPAPQTARGLVSKYFVFYAATVALIAWLRLPGLLSWQLNPDEGQFTAGAARLLVDPVFWRSVDTGSSGPLNIYPLTLPHYLFGWQPDFASSRLIGLLMLMGSVLLLHATLSRAYSDASGRLTMIPVVLTLALFHEPDYVHYTSEHGPILLLSISLYLLIRMSSKELSGQFWLPALAGFTLGMMPYTKMQGVPIAASMVLIFFHLLWIDFRSTKVFSYRALVRFSVGLLLPTAIALVLIDRFDLWSFVWESYIQANLLIYSNYSAIGAVSKTENFLMLLHGALEEFYPLVAAIVFAAGCYVVNLFALKMRSSRLHAESARPPLGLYATLYLAAAAYAVGRPGNNFLHYTLLLLPPLGLLLGTLVGEVEHQLQSMESLRSGRPLIRWPLVIAVLVLIGLSKAQSVYRIGNPYIRGAPKFLEEYRSAVARGILEVAPAGSTMTVWGWSPELYVETGLTQATRYGNTFWQAERSELQQRFMDEFVRELGTSRPTVFVDAMSPAMFYYWTVARIERASRRHEAYPALAAVIAREYELTREVSGVRIYRRKSHRQD